MMLADHLESDKMACIVSKLPSNRAMANDAKKLKALSRARHRER